MGIRIKVQSAVTLALILVCAGTALAEISVSINIAPPVLPVYVQPPVPAPGYIWTPGYWAAADGDYFWVPGTWVEPPQPGLLWTPGYWAASGGGFVWTAGYWAPEIGFYGGINYGFGYTGVGFQGGHWDHGEFFYNRAVTNVSDTHITNVYEKTVVNNVTVNHVSYNGGPGGTSARPTAHELAVAHGTHVAPTAGQLAQQRAASANKQSFASVNRGIPPVAATPKPGRLSGPGVVAARGGEGPGHAEPQAAAKSSQPPERGHALTAPSPTAHGAAPHSSAAGKPAPDNVHGDNAHGASHPPVSESGAGAAAGRPAAQPPRPEPREAPHVERAPQSAKEHQEQRPRDGA